MDTGHWRWLHEACDHETDEHHCSARRFPQKVPSWLPQEALLLGPRAVNLGRIFLSLLFPACEQRSDRPISWLL